MLSEGGIAENSRFLHLSDAQKSWFSASLLIASNADIMIFDDPFKYLESEMKVRFLEILGETAKKDKTIVVSSDEISDFENSAGFVAALNNGNLVLSGETETLLASHRLMPGASTISPDFKVIGPVLNERLVETTDEVGRSATLKEIVLGYVNGSSS
jgi:ABC-2 type transport system ATP-binding protein